MTARGITRRIRETDPPVCAVCGHRIHRTGPTQFGVLWLHDGGWDPTTPVHAAKPKES